MCSGMTTDNPHAVLVVEDEALLLISIADDLREAGYVVYEASNADQGIVLLEKHSSIRFLFTDIDMPGSMDGLKLSAYVKNRWPPIKILITSGKHFPDKHTLPGVFIPKPYVASVVINNIKAMQF
jgi:CheY-like chemotaxis protein